MKNLINKIIKLRLSPKREFGILIGVVILLLGAGFAISYYMQTWLYIGFSAGFAAIFSLAYLSRYGSMITVISRENLEEFVNLFSFFKIYIHNGFNVYSALKEITIFANPNLKELLDKLLEEIDDDKSVKPFVKFAKSFDEIIVEEMMISIYQMIDDGEQSNYLNQFEMIFDKFSDLIADKNLRLKDSSLNSLSSAPLVGSCFLIIMITIGIISVLGDMMNVL